MYSRSSIKKYLDDLAAKKPAPGGGSASALEAALACALISMVAQFTISNKKYAACKEIAKETLEKAEELRARLLGLVDEDVRAYTELSRAIACGKIYSKKPDRLDSLYRAACDVPYNTARCTNEALNLCAELVKFGNKNLITDTAIAALMLESAFRGAKFNVYNNLKYIKESAYAEKVHKVLSVLEETVPKTKEEILHACEEVIVK